MSAPTIPDSNPNRRQGPADRRGNSPDRRNPERLQDDIAPRRHPDLPDRRAPSGWAAQGNDVTALLDIDPMLAAGAVNADLAVGE